MSCCAVLCCAVLCCAVLCCAVLCCAVHMFKNRLANKATFKVTRVKLFIVLAPKGRSIIIFILKVFFYVLFLLASVFHCVKGLKSIKYIMVKWLISNGTG
jgi:hypothetical protein